MNRDSIINILGKTDNQHISVLLKDGEKFDGYNLSFDSASDLDYEDDCLTMELDDGKMVEILLYEIESVTHIDDGTERHMKCGKIFDGTELNKILMKHMKEIEDVDLYGIS